jgi:predicted nucleic acid-binding Zn ribbon protein
VIEFCCLAIFIVIIVFVVLAVISKEHTSKRTQTPPPRSNKVDGKICIKCSNVIPLDSQFCSHCGNEF